MRCAIIVIVLFVTFANYSQNKDGISVVQYSASFVKENEISLKEFNRYNTQTMYLSKNQKIFQKEKINSLPTVVLYNDGEEIYRAEGGISLTLDPNCIKEINKHIDKLLSNRF